ncbi:hypothetical protein CI610_00628 [invertebrate metagenome]|uniref:Uncharacterized protein n=1 Tax=invertebrate metagenome TaxID=1711999 RepID=A0A2H9TAX8_9ZZZZ
MFYLNNIQLDNAEVDMDTLSLQTLHMMDIRQPLEEALAEVPVIILTDHLPLSKQLANHAYTISKQDDYLFLSQMTDSSITENIPAL